jgi:membrane protease YdiL (CAAX protease family)
MEDHPLEYIRPAPQEPSAWASVFILLLTLLAGFIVVGPILGFLIAIPFIDGRLLDFASLLEHPIGHPEIKVPLLILQSGATFFGLAVGPALVWWVYGRKKAWHLLRNSRLPAIIVLTTVAIVICFMMPDSVVIDWNSKFQFPDFLRGFGAWARKNEDIAEGLTTFLTTFESPGQFIFGFIVIAVLAGFSEELVFRGMLQSELFRATRNIHVAIWTSAFLFSALHMQFFGFVPRLLLGALFGYLYAWSGNLVVPMLAHMVNNGISVIVVYLHQQGKVNLDIENAEPAPWPAAILFAFFLFALLFFFKRFYRRRNPASS